jgi:leucyl aminopeptidase
VIAYAAEEVGLRGSLAVVKEFKKRKINVVGALQLDMTNYQGSDRDIWLIDDHTDHAQNAFLVKLIETYTGATWGSDRCGYACSDHASWTRYGFRASMPFESRFRDSNREIHTVRDTLEMSDNNANHAVKFARLGAAYALELAKGPLAASTSLTATDDSAPAHRWPWVLGIATAIGLLALARRQR